MLLNYSLFSQWWDNNNWILLIKLRCQKPSATYMCVCVCRKLKQTPALNFIQYFWCATLLLDPSAEKFRIFVSILCNFPIRQLHDVTKGKKLSVCAYHSTGSSLRMQENCLHCFTLTQWVSSWNNLPGYAFSQRYISKG